ncbi:reverse transcriptase domain-containing protein [Tanacetum coccineum]|uniref:Reverse transcriptase domain-containing protein n=1 Tax=Tanacetum coccineum TaxID=301880 RepID=A0ABQ5IAH1_9ASTR
MVGQAPPQGLIPDLRSMEELLQAPTKGVGDAIVGAAQTWLEKEPPNSITTWNDLVSKFVNRFFPPSKTTNLQNEITRFQQRFSETFAEAWDRFKDLLNKCPHHGFSPLHQIDTFYNSLSQSDPDSLNSAANGNFLTKNTQKALTIIENKSKVQTSRNKSQVASSSGSSTQDAHVIALTKQVEALLSSFNRPINSVQNSCETCGGPHAYYECQAAGGYTQEDVYATTGTYNQGGNSYQIQGNRNLLSYRSNNFLGPPSFNQPNNQNQGNNQNYQNNQNRNQNQNQNRNNQNQGFNQNRNQNFNQGNNYNQNQGYNQNPGQNYNQNQVPNQSPSEEMMRQLLISNQSMQNEMADLKKILLQRPHGALPSNTEPNPREQVNSIMTRSGLTTVEPSIPPHVPPTPRVEVEKEPKTLMDEVHITSPGSTAHVPPPRVQPVSPPKPKEDPKPNAHQPKIPYPSRLNKTKLLDKNNVQISKQREIRRVSKYSINAECSAILLNKVPEKLEDPRKFLIPCILQYLEVYNSLADSRASINLMPLSIYEKLRVGPLKPTRMTLELANRSVTFSMGITEDVIVKVEKFNFLADFVIVDFEADPRVPIILGRPFLRTARALVDLYEEKLTLRVGNEEVVFYTDKFLHLSRLVILEEFADELALLDPFPPGNEDDNFDPEADLRKIEYLLNRDPSTVSSPTTDIDIINPILERFTDEPALVYSSLPGDDDDDLFDLKSDNDEWKKLLYGDSYNDTNSKNDKTKDSKTKILIDEANIVESNVLPPQLLTSDSTLPEESFESSEISTLLSSPFWNEDKVFNPGIFILGGTQIFNDGSKDKDLKDKDLILEECNFLSISSDQELLFHSELTVIETLLSFSSENKDKVFNPGILTSKGVHSFTLGLSHRTYETFKIINVHPNILNEGPMKIFPFFCFCPKDKGIRGESS